MMAGVTVAILVGVGVSVKNVGVEFGVVKMAVCVDAAFAVPATIVLSEFMLKVGMGAVKSFAAPQANMDKARIKSSLFIF